MADELFNQATEQSVLGALLLDNTAYDKIMGLVFEHDFTCPENRMIFRAQSRLFESGKPVDIVTVAEFLDSHKLLEQAGGINYLASLVQNTPSSANIEHYANTVHSYYLMRNMVAISAEISARISNRGELSAKDLLDFAQSKWMTIGESLAKNNTSMLPVSRVVDGVLAHLQALSENPNKSEITGLPSGFLDLDKMTTGFQPGELIILAARPSMGKTSLALNMIEHVAINEKKNVVFFSLEMAHKQIGSRLLSGLSRVNGQRLQAALLNESEWLDIANAAETLRESNIYIDEESSINVNEIRARCRRLHRELIGGLHMIVVDYITLIEMSGRNENRANQVAEVSRAFKLLAKELGVPVIVLSQLSRSCENRHDRRPIMSDLRDSGGIEQDADIILFLYRDQVYNDDTPDRELAEIIVAKQRNGPIGTAYAKFTQHLTRFENRPYGASLPNADGGQQSRFNAQNSRGNFRAKNDFSSVDM